MSTPENDRQRFIDSLGQDYRALLDRIDPEQRQSILDILYETQTAVNESFQILEYAGSVAQLSHILAGFAKVRDTLKVLSEAYVTAPITDIVTAQLNELLQNDARVGHMLFETLDTFQLKGYPILEGPIAPMAISLADAGIPFTLTRTTPSRTDPIHIHVSGDPSSMWEAILHSLPHVQIDEDPFIAPVVLSLTDIDRFRMERMRGMSESVPIDHLTRESMKATRSSYQHIMAGIPLNRRYFEE